MRTAATDGCDLEFGWPNPLLDLAGRQVKNLDLLALLETQMLANRQAAKGAQRLFVAAGNIALDLEEQRCAAVAGKDGATAKQGNEQAGKSSVCNIPSA